MMFSLLVGCLIPINAGLVNYYPDLAAIIPMLAGLTGVLLFAGIMILIYADKAAESSADREVLRPTLSQRSEPTNKLPLAGQQGSVSSVTEGTTDLLETIKTEVTRKRT
jgi:hypothetical protein